jgi:hypothetical protein
MRFAEFKLLNEDASFKLAVPKSSNDVAALQTALAAFDYNVKPTGTIDDLTVQAISSVQHDIGITVTGKPDASTIDAINIAMSAVPGMTDYMSKSAGQPASNPATPNVMSTPSATVSAGPAPTTASSKGRAVIIGNEKRTGGTISWRTNNPGNVMYGDRAKRFGAIGSVIAGDGEPVAIMPTLDHGWKMQIALWRSPTYNNGTIEQGCKTWAVGVRHYKGTSPYTISLADAAGASKNTKVSDLSNEQLKNMVKRQAKWEGFKVGTVTTV